MVASAVCALLALTVLQAANGLNIPHNALILKPFQNSHHTTTYFPNNYVHQPVTLLDGVRKCPKQVVYYGNACSCQKLLPYTVELPKSPPVVPYGRSYGYQVQLPPAPVILPTKTLGYTVEVPKKIILPPAKYSYGYKIQAPAPEPKLTLHSYDYNLEVPIENQLHSLPLQGLTSTVDRLALPRKDCVTPTPLSLELGSSSFKNQEFDLVLDHTLSPHSVDFGNSLEVLDHTGDLLASGTELGQRKTARRKCRGRNGRNGRRQWRGRFQQPAVLTDDAFESDAIDVLNHGDLAGEIQHQPDLNTDFWPTLVVNNADGGYGQGYGDGVRQGYADGVRQGYGGGDVDDDTIIQTVTAGYQVLNKPSCYCVQGRLLPREQVAEHYPVETSYVDGNGLWRRFTNQAASTKLLMQQGGNMQGEGRWSSWVPDTSTQVYSGKTFTAIKNQRVPSQNQFSQWKHVPRQRNGQKDDSTLFYTQGRNFENNMEHSLERGLDDVIDKPADGQEKGWSDSASSRSNNLENADAANFHPLSDGQGERKENTRLNSASSVAVNPSEFLSSNEHFGDDLMGQGTMKREVMIEPIKVQYEDEKEGTSSDSDEKSGTMHDNNEERNRREARKPNRDSDDNVATIEISVRNGCRDSSEEEDESEDGNLPRGFVAQQHNQYGAVNDGAIVWVNGYSPATHSDVGKTFLFSQGNSYSQVPVNYVRTDISNDNSAITASRMNSLGLVSYPNKITAGGNLILTDSQGHNYGPVTYTHADIPKDNSLFIVPGVNTHGAVGYTHAGISNENTVLGASGVDMHVPVKYTHAGISNENSALTASGLNTHVPVKYTHAGISNENSVLGASGVNTHVPLKYTHAGISNENSVLGASGVNMHVPVKYTHAGISNENSVLGASGVNTHVPVKYTHAGISNENTVLTASGVDTQGAVGYTHEGISNEKSVLGASGVDTHGAVGYTHAGISNENSVLGASGVDTHGSVGYTHAGISNENSVLGAAGVDTHGAVGYTHAGISNENSVRGASGVDTHGAVGYTHAGISNENLVIQSPGVKVYVPIKNTHTDVPHDNSVIQSPGVNVHGPMSHAHTDIPNDSSIIIKARGGASFGPGNYVHIPVTHDVRNEHHIGHGQNIGNNAGTSITYTAGCYDSVVDGYDHKDGVPIRQTISLGGVGLGDGLDNSHHNQGIVSSHGQGSIHGQGVVTDEISARKDTHSLVLNRLQDKISTHAVSSGGMNAGISSSLNNGDVNKQMALNSLLLNPSKPLSGEKGAITSPTAADLLISQRHELLASTERPIAPSSRPASKGNNILTPSEELLKHALRKSERLSHTQSHSSNYLGDHHQSGLHSAHEIGNNLQSSLQSTHGIGSNVYSDQQFTHAVGHGHDSNVQYGPGIGSDIQSNLQYTQGIENGQDSHLQYGPGIENGIQSHIQYTQGVGNDQDSHLQYAPGIENGIQSHLQYTQEVGNDQDLHLQYSPGIGSDIQSHLQYTQGIGNDQGSYLQYGPENGIQSHIQYTQGVGNDQDSHLQYAPGIESGIQSHLQYTQGIGDLSQQTGGIVDSADMQGYVGQDNSYPQQRYLPGVAYSGADPLYTHGLTVSSNLVHSSDLYDQQIPIPNVKEIQDKIKYDIPGQQQQKFGSKLDYREETHEEKSDVHKVEIIQDIKDGHRRSEKMTSAVEAGGDSGEVSVDQYSTTPVQEMTTEYKDSSKSDRHTEEHSESVDHNHHQEDYHKQDSSGHSEIQEDGQHSTNTVQGHSSPKSLMDFFREYYIRNLKGARNGAEVEHIEGSHYDLTTQLPSKHELENDHHISTHERLRLKEEMDNSPLTVNNENLSPSQSHYITHENEDILNTQKSVTVDTGSQNSIDSTHGVSEIQDGYPVDRDSSEEQYGQVAGSVPGTDQHELLESGAFGPDAQDLARGRVIHNRYVNIIELPDDDDDDDDDDDIDDIVDGTDEGTLEIEEIEEEVSEDSEDSKESDSHELFPNKFQRQMRKRLRKVHRDGAMGNHHSGHKPCKKRHRRRKFSSGLFSKK